MKKKALKLQQAAAETNSKENMVSFRKLIQPTVTSTLMGLVAAQHGVKVSFEIMKLNDSVRKLHDQYETLRSGLLNKYGKKGSDGKLEIVEDRYVIENKEGFDREYEELLSLEVEVPRIPLSYLTVNPDVKLAPLQLKLLMETIVDATL